MTDYSFGDYILQNSIWFKKVNEANGILSNMHASPAFESSMCSYQYASIYQKGDTQYLHNSIFERRLQQNNPQHLTLNIGVYGNAKHSKKKLVQYATKHRQIAHKLQSITYHALGMDSYGIKDFEYLKLNIDENESSYLIDTPVTENSLPISFAVGLIRYLEPDFLVTYDAFFNQLNFYIIVKYFPFYSNYDNMSKRWTSHYVTEEYK